jgi:hypothetical protein
VTNLGQVETEGACRVAQLQADNAQLRRLAAELQGEVRQLRLAVTMKRGRPPVAPAHRLRVMSGGEARVSEA